VFDFSKPDLSGTISSIFALISSLSLKGILLISLIELIASPVSLFEKNGEFSIIFLIKLRNFLFYSTIASSLF